MRVNVVETVQGTQLEMWRGWPVSWSAVWVGALATVAFAMVFGLVSVAVGAHELGAAGQITNWREVSLAAVAFAILGAFLSAALGGWGTGKISGIQRAEPSMLHGAITWLLAVPLILGLVALGAGNAFGGWYGGLMGSPVWMTVPTAPPDPNAAIVAHNGALTAVTALLLGLMGAVIGGWIASGEPMTFAYYRKRAAELRAAGRSA